MGKIFVALYDVHNKGGPKDGGIALQIILCNVLLLYPVFPPITFIKFMFL